MTLAIVNFTESHTYWRHLSIWRNSISKLSYWILVDFYFNKQPRLDWINFTGRHLVALLATLRNVFPVGDVISHLQLLVNQSDSFKMLHSFLPITFLPILKLPPAIPTNFVLNWVIHRSSDSRKSLNASNWMWWWVDLFVEMEHKIVTVKRAK